MAFLTKADADGNLKVLNLERNSDGSFVNSNYANPDFRLRRLVRCGHCGRSLTAGWSKGRRKRYAYYSCPRHCGSHPSIPRELLEREADRYLANVRCTDGTLELLAVLARAAYQKRTALLSRQQREAAARAKSLMGMRQALVEKNLAGIYSDEHFLEHSSLIDRRLEEAQKVQEGDLLERYSLESVAEFVRGKARRLSQTCNEADLAQLRLLISSIFPSQMEWLYPGYSEVPISPFYSRRGGF